MAKRLIVPSTAEAARIAAAVRKVEGTSKSSPQISSATRLPDPKRYFVGKLTPQGPDDEEDYDDARYWVLRCRVTNESEPAGKVELEPFNPDDDSYACVTATNLAEIVDNTHDLEPETRVIVFWEYDQSTPSRPRYWFSAGGTGGKPVWVKITGYQTLPGQTNRWGYSWVEQRLMQYGQWQDKEDGLTSTDTGIVAYNTVEANNSGSGVQGNSINITGLPEGANLLPVQGSPVVPAWFVSNCAAEIEGADSDDENYLELIFGYENAISTPPCDAEGA